MKKLKKIILIALIVEIIAQVFILIMSNIAPYNNYWEGYIAGNQVFHALALLFIVTRLGIMGIEKITGNKLL
jgi:hypothetical protein